MVEQIHDSTEQHSLIRIQTYEGDRVTDMSNSNTQPKPLLPNPFNLSDTEIVEKVYVLSHTYDDQVFDNEPLFNVVSNVIKLSTQIVGALHKVINKMQSSACFANDMLDSFF